MKDRKSEVNSIMKRVLPVMIVILILLIVVFLFLPFYLVRAADNYAKSFLPRELHVGKAIYSSSLLEFPFAVYHLDSSDAAMIDRNGIQWFSDKVVSRESGKLIYMPWRTTPMFTSTGLNVPGDKTETVTIAVNQKRSVTEYQSAAISKIRAASIKTGSFFTVDQGRECGILVDRVDSLILLACEDK